MTSSEHKLSPFERLKQADEQIRERTNLQQAGQHREEWTGVLFRVGDDKLLAPMSMLVEIVPPPPLVRVPGVKPWILGLANLHGALIPAIDLQGFLLERNQILTTSTVRMLVVSDGDGKYGLIVPEVFGMKHFWVSDEVHERPPLHAALEPFVAAALKRYGELFCVMDVKKLLSDERLKDVSL